MLFRSAGLTINLAFPVFDWENEVRVVKQSASTMLTLLLSMISSMIPIVLLILFGDLHMIINAATVVMISAATLVLYKRNQKVTV